MAHPIRTFAFAAMLAAGVSATALAAGVEVKHVSFKSGGETLVGDLYVPSDAEGGTRPGIVVTGSWTSVKEQMAGLYARSLAERGLVALAFDFRNFGESGGGVRDLESAKLKEEDITAAADFLGHRPEVATGEVGGLSVCASSGYMAHAIADGAAIRSYATVAAWLHDPASARALYTPAGYDAFLAQGRAAEADYKLSGKVDYVPAFSMTDKQAAMQGTSPGYYGDPERGAIPQWENRFAQMGWVEWLTFDALSAAPGITIPTLMVHSDGSALPDNVRRFYAELKGPKSLYWMQGQHLDFYDRPALVSEAADVVAAHFHRTLPVRTD